MIKVLFVCLGNICRSPLAEGIFNRRIMEMGLQDHISVDSCGTSGYHIGDPPDSRTVSNAITNGLTLDHKARQFEKRDFRTFTYILPMDAANRKNILRLDHTSEFQDKIMLMRSFDLEEPHADVPDPYFGGEDGFQQVYEILDRSVNELLKWIIDKHNLPA